MTTQATQITEVVRVYAPHFRSVAEAEPYAHKDRDGDGSAVYLESGDYMVTFDSGLSGVTYVEVESWTWRVFLAALPGESPASFTARIRALADGERAY